MRDSKGENAGKCGGDDAEDEQACEAFLEFVARVPGREEVDAGCLEGEKGRGVVVVSEIDWRGERKREVVGNMKNRKTGSIYLLSLFLSFPSLAFSLNTGVYPIQPRKKK